MRLRENYRVPLLLLGCLVTALLFPRACAETRAGLGGLVPATAPLTAAESGAAETALREENAHLRAQLARLAEDRDARPPTQGDFAQDVRVVRPPASRSVVVAARVTHRDVSPMRRSFLLDVGRADGVNVGDPVVWSSSLIGFVVTASAHAARVVRIDDPSPSSIVAAAVLTGAPASPARRGPGVSRGTGDGLVRVSFLRLGDAKPGDLVVTAVGDARIPRDLVRNVPDGLVLGEVVGFGDDDRDGSFEAEVRPLRDLESVESVVVFASPGRSGPAVRAGGYR